MEKQKIFKNEVLKTLPLSLMVVFFVITPINKYLLKYMVRNNIDIGLQSLFLFMNTALLITVIAYISTLILKVIKRYRKRGKDNE